MTKIMKCPVCEMQITPKLIESHTDPIEGVKYKIYSCPACEVEFSDPMKSESPGYQVQVDPCRRYIYSKKIDWRHKTFFRKNTVKQGNLLDIGCGCGNFLLSARKKFTVTGIDFDERMIDVGKSWGLTNIYAMSFDDFLKTVKDKYDIITLFDVFEHLPTPANFIRQVKTLLNSNGTVVITVPNMDRPMLFPREKYDFPPRHLTRWSKSSLLKFLEMNGFEITVCAVSPVFIKNVYTNAYSFFVPRIVMFIKSILFSDQVKNQPLNVLIDNSKMKNMKNSKYPVLKLMYNQSFRQKTILFLSNILYVLVWPVCFGVSVYWNIKKLKNPDLGNTLFVMAKLKE